MECKERLQLIRALYALSQQELAEMIGTGRTFIAAIEKGRRPLPTPLAKALCDKLHVDAEWLTDESSPQPLQGSRLLFIDYPPRKVLAAARNIRALRLNDSISMIEKLWPAFMEQHPAQRCWLAEMADDQKIILVLFHANQGILFRLSGVNALAESLLDSVRKCKDVEFNLIEIDREQFDGVTRQQSYILEFLQKCGVEQHLQHIFFRAAGNVIPAFKTQVRELSGKMRRSVLEKVCAEIMENDLTMAEIEDFLKSRGRRDLIKATSH